MEEESRVIYKKKKSTGKTVTIVILLILLFGALFYIGYLELQNINKKDQEAKKEVRSEMYYSEVKQMLSQIELYNEVFYEFYPIKDITKIENQAKLKFALHALKKDENISNYYKIEDMKEIYLRYFKKGFQAVYENIDCPVGGHLMYQLEKGTYTYQDEAHGGINIDIDTYFQSGKINGQKYIINTHILYSNYCSDICPNIPSGYYKTYQEAKEKKNPIMNRKSEYHEVEDEIPITIFTFTKEKNHFLLESIEID